MLLKKKKKTSMTTNHFDCNYLSGMLFLTLVCDFSLKQKNSLF